MSFLWFLHDLRSPVLDVVFQFITFFGEELLIVIVMCGLYWCVNRELAYGVFLSFFVSLLLVQGMKIAFRVERPWLLDPAFAPVASAIAGATGFSFPSGHTQSAASLFGYLGIASSKKKWIVLSWVLVALVGLSRMYLGVHTPADVLVSMAVSLAVILLTRAFLKSSKPDTVLMAVLAALSLIEFVFGFMLYRRGVISYDNVADCCKAAGGCLGCAIALYWARRRVTFDTRTPKPWQQIVKLAVGLVGLILLQSGLKLLYTQSLPLDTLRYFLIAIWAIAVYPLLFTRVLRMPDTAA